MDWNVGFLRQKIIVGIRSCKNALFLVTGRIDFEQGIQDSIFHFLKYDLFGTPKYSFS